MDELYGSSIFCLGAAEHTVLFVTIDITGTWGLYSTPLGLCALVAL